MSYRNCRWCAEEHELCPRHAAEEELTRCEDDLVTAPAQVADNAADREAGWA